MVTPILELKQTFSDCNTGADYCNALYAHLEKTKLLEQLSAACQSEDAEKTIAQQQDAKYIWEQFLSILDTIYRLYCKKPTTTADFCQTISYLFQTITYATPPRTLDAVLIGQTGRSRLRDPKIVFVIHCNDFRMTSCFSSIRRYSRSENKSAASPVAGNAPSLQ